MSNLAAKLAKILAESQPSVVTAIQPIQPPEPSPSSPESSPLPERTKAISGGVWLANRYLVTGGVLLVAIVVSGTWSWIARSNRIERERIEAMYQMDLNRQRQESINRWHHEDQRRLDNVLQDIRHRELLDEQRRQADRVILSRPYPYSDLYRPLRPLPPFDPWMP